jgi:hypothetical protein
MAKAMVCDRDTAESTLRRLLPVDLMVRSHPISVKCSHFMIERGRSRVANYWNTTGRLLVGCTGLWEGLSPEKAAEAIMAWLDRPERTSGVTCEESESGDMFPQVDCLSAVTVPLDPAIAAPWEGEDSHEVSSMRSRLAGIVSGSRART